MFHYFVTKNGCVVLHSGASEEARSWPDSYWVELVGLLIPEFKVSVVVTRESFDLVESLRKKGLSLQYFEGSLVDFSQYINFQKCLIAPDSMAGHLSSYFGIPVISLFGSQDPSLTKPKNKFGKVIKPQTPCSHVSEHWRLCKLCMESISPKTVHQAALKHISYIESVL